MDPNTNPDLTPNSNDPKPDDLSKQPVPGQGPKPDGGADPKPDDKTQLDESPNVEGLEADPVVYEETGDTSLDLVLAFVGKLGFAPEHPAMKAASDGDFGPLSEAMKKLGAKADGWERFIKLGQEVYKAKTDSQKSKDEALVAALGAAVGGAEVWDKVRTWASQNATPEEKAEVNAALKLGGRVATHMAKALYEAWVANGEREPEATRKTTSGTGAPRNEPLTAAGYTKAVAELHRRVRGDLEGKGAKEYAILQQRREAARRAGH